MRITFTCNNANANANANDTLQHFHRVALHLLGLILVISASDIGQATNTRKIPLLFSRSSVSPLKSHANNNSGGAKNYGYFKNFSKCRGLPFQHTPVIPHSTNVYSIPFILHVSFRRSSCNSKLAIFPKFKRVLHGNYAGCHVHCISQLYCSQKLGASI